ncbi:Hpt domain-containing protein [Shimia abyssi]|uniref:Hpt domain-containing protein n=1 Tax=Shimia abyssi TaxID=1662395 RepID=A0A2P8FDF1_9RHOB|nr:Hpt domain-containing protein [Shimia abyssi]PSL19698.1 Hpt domain-containing protein [Shimia abyssi]
MAKNHHTALAALRSRFVAGLPKREEELEDLTATLLTKGPCPQTLEQLYFAVHKLAGIGATYGLTAMGRQAEITEQLIDTARQNKSTGKTLVDILLATELLTDELRAAVARG